MIIKSVVMRFDRKAFLTWFLFLGICLVCPIHADPLRSFADIFPGLDDNQKSSAFSDEGFKRSFTRNESPSVTPARSSGIDLFSVVKEKDPSHFIEALMVIPYSGEPLGLKNAYRALTRIEDIKNHTYFNRSRNVHITAYTESTRIESAGKNKPIPDPPPSETYPASEEIFLRLKDSYFGNMYFRGDVSAGSNGITFTLTNNRPIRYFLVPIMRSGKFCAILYLEPLEEGMLVYGMGAVDIPNFIASRINIASSVQRRLSVFIDWIKKGLE